MPSWGFLGLMGLIGGGPTFLGTLIGQAWVSPALEIGVLRGRGRLDPLRRDPALRGLPALSMPQLVGWMLLGGILLGFGTDWVLVAAGA